MLSEKIAGNRLRWTVTLRPARSFSTLWPSHAPRPIRDESRADGHLRAPVVVDNDGNFNRWISSISLSCWSIVAAAAD